MKKVGCFEALWLFIWSWIKESEIYKILTRIYSGITKSWKNSRITNWFRKDIFSKEVLLNSVAGKILKFPFTVLDWIKLKYGEKLASGISKSLILNICRDYLNGFLAINLRFIGAVMLTAAIGIMIGTGIHFAGIAFVILGGILLLFNINLTDWLGGSLAVTLGCRAFGVETDFNWYKETKISPVVGGIFGFVCGVAGGVTSPILGVGMIIAFAGLFLVLSRPKTGMFLIVLFAPLLPTMVMAGLSMLTVFSLIVKGITDPDFQWKYDGMGFLLLGFIVVYLFAGITSFAVVKSLSIWAIYIAFMSSYFVIINLAKSKKDLRNLLTTFVISGLFVCLYGIAQYVFGWDTTQAWMDEEMFTDIKMRIYSTLENPNVLGEYILLVLPVAVGLMWTRKSLFQKIIYGGSAIVMLIALILTFSRGCWLGLIAAAAVFITFAAGKLWGLALLALPVLPMILPESIIDRFTSIGDMEDSSTSYRVYIWMGTLAMIKDFWISGVGMGTEAFTAVYPFYSYSGISAPHSHNLFLQIWVESGIGGILIFFGILLFFLKRMMNGYQFGGGKGGEISTVITALAAGVCGFLLQGMFDNCFYNYRVMLVFWCVIGISMAAYYIAKEREADKC